MGQPVVVELPVLPVGETPFQCGMNMVRGVVVVSAPVVTPAPPVATSTAPAEPAAPTADPTAGT